METMVIQKKRSAMKMEDKVKRLEKENHELLSQMMTPIAEDQDVPENT